ncbi:hypothetical protein ACR6HW_04050 [Fusibacter sp. JL298sf-3]
MELNQLVKYCDNQYLNSKSICDIPHCEKCLENIHYGSERRYNCENMTNYYVCKYIHKYSSEIYHIFANFNKLYKLNKEINVLSIGCGSCSDFFGISSALESVRTNYYGIDLNEEWKHIHDYIKKNSRSTVEYTYRDIFDIINSDLSNIEFHILSLQYMLSDLIKYKTVDEINCFFQALVRNIIFKMPKNSIIIINDINYREPRDCFWYLLNNINKLGIEYSSRRLHFSHNIKKHYRYGEKYANNSLVFDIDEDIVNKYHPWQFCSSAQLIVRKEE